MRHNEHYVVFGAYPQADKGVLAYHDRKTGMWAVKIMQLKDECRGERGESFELSEIDGEYTTIYFANRHGRESLRMFRECLTDLEKMWDEEEAAK